MYERTVARTPSPSLTAVTHRDTSARPHTRPTPIWDDEQTTTTRIVAGRPDKPPQGTQGDQQATKPTKRRQAVTRRDSSQQPKRRADPPKQPKRHTAVTTRRHLRGRNGRGAKGREREKARQREPPEGGTVEKPTTNASTGCTMRRTSADQQMSWHESTRGRNHGETTWPRPGPDRGAEAERAPTTS